MLRSLPSFFALILVFIVVFLLVFPSISPSFAQTTLTAYKSQQSVSLDGIVQAGEWNDTQPFHDPISGMTISFKQNGTGLLALVVWAESTACQTCYAALEFGPLNNTGHMGSPSTPTTMVIISPSLKGNVDEAVTAGEQTPTFVEEFGYKEQSTVGLAYSNGEYTAELYRPFETSGGDPYELNLTVGSTVELGLAVGDFASPGTHSATDMNTYLLQISNALFTPSTTITSATTASSTFTASTAPNVTYYWAELAITVVGFMVLVLLAIRRRS